MPAVRREAADAINTCADRHTTGHQSEPRPAWAGEWCHGSATIEAIRPHFLDEVRSRISLTSLVGRDANLERRGRLHVACCPFHAEKTPSFTVYEDGHYHCFGCQAHGDAIDYVRQRDGLAFRAAVAALATEVGMVLPRFLLLITPAVSLILAGCASVQLDRQKPTATTLAPFNAQLGER